jgi:hypothetical protein
MLEVQLTAERYAHRAVCERLDGQPQASHRFPLVFVI